MSLDLISNDYKLVLLPPSTPNSIDNYWYGYVVHEGIRDLDEKIYARGPTAGKVATELIKKLIAYAKSNK